MRYRDAVPPGAVRRWAAELVTALESLHAAGVVCVWVPALYTGTAVLLVHWTVHCPDAHS